MKRLLSFSMAILMSISLVACGGSESKKESTKKETAQTQSIDIPDLTKVEGEITVSNFQLMPNMPGKESFLDSAAKKFMEKYPNTKVTIKNEGQGLQVKTAEGEEGVASISGMENLNQNLMDYNKQVNIDLMSGEGADVYSLANALPVMQLADQGFLEDLSPYMKADKSFDASQYYTNVFDSMKYKGALYGLATDFTFSYLTLDKRIFSEAEQKELIAKNGLTFDEVLDYGIKVRAKQGGTDKTAINLSLDSIVPMYIARNADEFIDYTNKKVMFSDSNLTQMLEKFKSYEEDGTLPPRLNMDAENVDINKVMTEYMSKEYPFYVTYSPEMPYQYLLNSEMDIPESTRATLEMTYGNKVGVGHILSNNGKALLEPAQSYGINANSKNKQLAWAFVKFLIEEDMQSSLSLYGTPVLKTAMVEKSKSIFSGTVFSNTGEPDTNKTLTEKQQKAMDEYVAALDQYIQRLDGYIYSDSTVEDMLSKQLLKFDSGEQTAKETVDALQNSVQLYINE